MPGQRVPARPRARISRHARRDRSGLLDAIVGGAVGAATLPYRNAKEQWVRGHQGPQDMREQPYRLTGIVMPPGPAGVGGRSPGIAFKELPPVVQQALRLLAMQRNPAVQGSLGLFPMDEYRVRQERRKRPRRRP